MANRERVVGFAVKARDEYSKVLKNLEQQQNKLSAAAKAAQRRAVTGLAKGEFDEASANYRRLLGDVERYRVAQANAAKTGKLSAAEMRELGETIKLTRDRAREALTALNQKRAALDRLGAGARVGYAAFDRLAVSMQRSSAEAREETAAVAGSATQLNKLTSASNTAAAAQGALAKRMDGATAAMGRQRRKGGVGKGFARGENQDVEIWGLKPWQLTNLGYQVNDVVSGLAMGQAPIQILAQQAGQFAQIWPNVMVAMARSVPVIAAVTAVLAPFVAVGLRLAGAAESVRVFSQNLNLSADGARYTAEGLAAAVEEMRAFGVATDDARTMLLQFVRDGISDAEFKPLAQMAKQLSAVSGEGVTETAAKLSKAFSGTVDDVRELDKELNFLTASQLETIRAMAKAGDTAGALSLAQEILRGRLASTVRESGPWSDAIDSMANAWGNFVDAIEASGIVQQAAAHLRALGTVAKNTAGLIEAATEGLASGSEIEQAIVRLRELNALLVEERELTAAGINAIDDTPAMIEERNAVIAILDARREQLQVLKDANEVQQATSESDKKARLDIQQIIDKQLETLALETKQAELTNREWFIEEELLKAKNAALEEAKRLNQDILGLTEEQTAEIRAQAALNFEKKWIAQGGLGEFAKKVSGIESGNNPLAKASSSSATGLGQFIEATWLRMFKEYFPDRAAGMTREAILMLRENADISTSMIELYAKENAAHLQKAGAAVTEANLYLAHFLGPSGAIAVLTAKASEPVENLLSSGALNANPFLSGMTAGDLQAWAAKKVGAASAELEINKELVELDRKRIEYTQGLGERLKTKQLELDLERQASKEAYIAKELAEEETRARKEGATLTQEQIAKIRELATAEWEVAHANDEVNRLVALRTALFQSLQIAQQAGDQGKVASVAAEIAAVELQLGAAIPKAIEFWKALGGPGAAQAVAELEAVQASIGQVLQKLETKFLPSAIELNEELANTGANAFGAFAQAIAEGENAVEAFFNALRQGIAEFLIEIGKAIVKQAIFNAISGGVGASGGGGIGGVIGGWIARLFHEGGIVGSRGGPNRMVNPAIFAGANRYHVGGLAGLKPGEVPIVAMEEEEILTRDDPRHVLNGGKTGSAVNIKNVNVFDPNDVMEAALATVSGERVMLNFLTRNSRKVAAAING